MKPNPVDMMMFLEVAETRSFTAAAAKLGRTTSALSQAVSRLERDLNCRLFYRTTRSLSLTDAGVQTISYCRHMHNTYQSAKSELQNLQSDPSGVLSITAPHVLCRPLITPVLTEYCQTYPNLDVRLIADDAPIDPIERQIDLSIRIGEPTGATARITKVGVLNKGLYASPEYIAKQGGQPESFVQLETWEHIANEWQGAPVTYSGPDAEAISVNPRYRCNTVHDVLHFAVAGAGVGLLPDIAAEESLSLKKLVKLYDLFPAPVYAVHQFERKAPAKVRKFVAALKAAFKKESP